MSLRGGAAVDDYHAAPQFDAEVDRPTPEYLEKYYRGIPHIDAVSWRYYLPILTEHALRNVAAAESNAVDAFLASLRPPDREPPRFASLTAELEGAVVAMLDTLAFDRHRSGSLRQCSHSRTIGHRAPCIGALVTTC